MTGAKVAPGSLTGRQIRASTLGTVPQAKHANNADNATNSAHAALANHATSAGTPDTAGGVQPVHASFSGDANTAERQLFSTPGVTMSASCDSLGEPTVKFSFSQPNIMWHYDFKQVTGGSGSGSGDVNSANSSPPLSQAFALGTDGTYLVHFVFTDAALDSVTGDFYVVKNAFSGAKACVVAGTAFAS